MCVPNAFLKWFGRVKLMDLRQTWRAKLVLNVNTWLICACAPFVPILLGNLVCPKEQYRLCRDSGEVFDMTDIAAVHTRLLPVLDRKSIDKYAGIDGRRYGPHEKGSGAEGFAAFWPATSDEGQTARATSAAAVLAIRRRHYAPATCLSVASQRYINH
ncbi:hypothetical protein OF83DRAFT_1179477 [Amylostereum chailletii]|nr:hypothetical protein OF83DRAFT_1179477 [Amylostereum chailletii]